MRLGSARMARPAVNAQQRRWNRCSQPAWHKTRSNKPLRVRAGAPRRAPARRAQPQRAAAGAAAPTLPTHAQVRPACESASTRRALQRLLCRDAQLGSLPACRAGGCAAAVRRVGARRAAVRAGSAPGEGLLRAPGRCCCDTACRASAAMRCTCCARGRRRCGPVAAARSANALRLSRPVASPAARRCGRRRTAAARPVSRASSRHERHVTAFSCGFCGEPK